MFVCKGIIIRGIVLFSFINRLSNHQGGRYLASCFLPGQVQLGSIRSFLSSLKNTIRFITNWRHPYLFWIVKDNVQTSLGRNTHVPHRNEFHWLESMFQKLRASPQMGQTLSDNLTWKGYLCIRQKYARFNSQTS